MSRSADLVVIGGGIHGCAAALFCAKRGLKVILLEKETIARHASGANAGGVRRLGRHLAEVPISVRSMALWHRIGEILDDDTGFSVAPQIKVAETEAELDTLRARVRELNGMGFFHEVILERAELRAHLPAVADHAVGGLAVLDDGFAQPFWTTFAFANQARREGVDIRENHESTRIERKDGAWHVEANGETFVAPKLLNTAGAWGGRLAESLGERAPLEPVAPMMIVTGRLPHFCDAVVGAAGRPLSFKQMPNGTCVIGGGRRGRADAGSGLSEILFPELRRTAETAMSLFPIMRGASIVRSWSGVEGRMPDDIPVIGPSTRHEGLYHAFGYSAHGFQMGPGVGELMAELISTGATQSPIAPFSIGRFAQG
ncbi:FAD-dependent oxidoreductase [Palleronia sp. LCG004]|uniref:NAD(P)/FAD-dependent oxidoreductase n=1 Tax=Palleronia sp. LCG004 TaxID=3079304 RepID=UPI002942906D|nr:FAD-dependent oxidoreductase [Palleronia sp. LCG004]WOI58248.1 FAD-dependent oxidoreductase [Palleronia sp. LCG004]